MSGLRLSTSGNSELADGTRFLPASWALGTVSIEAENTSSGSSEAPIPPPPGPTLLTLWAPRSFTPKMSWAEMFPAPWTGAGSFEHVWLGDSDGENQQRVWKTCQIVPKKRGGVESVCLPGRVNLPPDATSTQLNWMLCMTPSAAKMMLSVARDPEQLITFGLITLQFSGLPWKQGGGLQTLELRIISHGWGQGAGAGEAPVLGAEFHTVLCRMGCTNWGLTYENPSKSDWSMLAMTS